MERYALDFSRAIGKSQNYPRRALQMGWQGKVELEVRVNTEGKVREVHVAKSSGYPMLDEEAVAMVKRTGQLPAVPAEFRGRDFTVLVPVVFRID
jgi:protein TonB